MNKHLYKTVIIDIKNKIHNGILKEGDNLPTENELQQQYNVSRNTIRTAINNLVEDGLIEKIQGSGTFIKKSIIQNNLFQLKGFTEKVLSEHKTPEVKVIKFEFLSCPKNIATILKIKEHSNIFKIMRVMSINSEPEILEITYMPFDLFSDLTVDIMINSKYEYIQKIKNYHIKQSKQKISPFLANKEIATLLNISSKKAILKIQSIGELYINRVFEYTIQYYSCNRYQFEFTSFK